MQWQKLAGSFSGIRLKDVVIANLESFLHGLKSSCAYDLDAVDAHVDYGGRRYSLPCGVDVRKMVVAFGVERSRGLVFK